MHKFIRDIIYLKSVLGYVLRPRRNLKLIQKHLKEQLPYPPRRGQVIWCFFDYLWFKIRYRGSLDVDYFKAQMFRKSALVRKESLSRYKRFPWRDSYQEKTLWSIFRDKRIFYASFCDDLHRNWMVVDENTSWDEFDRFCNSVQNKIFAKEPISSGGAGVKFYDLKNNEEKKKLYTFAKEKTLIIEEPIRQCNEIYDFTGISVNTMRIITLVDDNGVPHVAAAALRMGNGGSYLDNFSSGGMGALVDIETGIISGPGKDRTGSEYLIHPYSGKQIVGFHIPDWESYKTYALKLAKRYPTMRYVGWDIVKNAQGEFCVIEGNKDAAPDVIECHLNYGLLPYYCAILHNDQNFNFDKFI